MSFGTDSGSSSRTHVPGWRRLRRRPMFDSGCLRLPDYVNSNAVNQSTGQLPRVARRRAAARLGVLQGAHRKFVGEEHGCLQDLLAVGRRSHPVVRNGVLVGGKQRVLHGERQRSLSSGGFILAELCQRTCCKLGRWRHAREVYLATTQRRHRRATSPSCLLVSRCQTFFCTCRQGDASVRRGFPEPEE